MQRSAEAITIARRFCGPPNSGNGGYSAGSLAQLIGGAVEVTLRHPPPLDQPLRIERGASVQAFDGEQLVLEGAAKQLELELPSPPPTWASKAMCFPLASPADQSAKRVMACGSSRGDTLRTAWWPRRGGPTAASPPMAS
jgi:hypothetical protein